MDAIAWRDLPKTVKKSRKGYTHFDYRTNIQNVWNYISDPLNIAHHSFYPFIHYKKEFTKYNQKKGIKVKERDICYAAHRDSCIFQYYCFLLDELYKQRIRRDGIESIAVAYRTDLEKNNIDLAKCAFDFIRENAPCYVMIGDFTGFFDNLDHQYLKRRWSDLLGLKFLPEDHYAVFKNITSYSTWELKDLLELNGLPDTSKGRHEFNHQSRALSPEQFKKNRMKIKKNTNSFGIPQGSPISALLANVYMLESDFEIKKYVDTLNGFYMRYSDDFMIVLPGIDNSCADKCFSAIMNQFNAIPGLKLQPEKTQFFYFDGETLENCGKRFYKAADCGHRFINFLGFTFDGKVITIRSKTTSKYYYRMRRKAKTIYYQKKKRNKRKVGCKNLYIRYSERGSYGKKGNYLTYVRRASKIFGPNEHISKDTKRHMQKIRKAMNHA